MLILVISILAVGLIIVRIISVLNFKVNPISGHLLKKASIQHLVMAIHMFDNGVVQVTNSTFEVFREYDLHNQMTDFNGDIISAIYALKVLYDTHICGKCFDTCLKDWRLDRFMSIYKIPECNPFLGTCQSTKKIELKGLPILSTFLFENGSVIIIDGVGKMTYKYYGCGSEPNDQLLLDLPDVLIYLDMLSCMHTNEDCPCQDCYEDSNVHVNKILDTLDLLDLNTGVPCTPSKDSNCGPAEWRCDGEIVEPKSNSQEEYVSLFAYIYEDM